MGCGHVTSRSTTYFALPPTGVFVSAGRAVADTGALARPDQREHRLNRPAAERDVLQVGEIKRIDMTLTFLRAKHDDTRRRLRRPAVNLGIPALTRTADQQEKSK